MIYLVGVGVGLIGVGVSVGAGPGVGPGSAAIAPPNVSRNQSLNPLAGFAAFCLAKS